MNLRRVTDLLCQDEITFHDEQKTHTKISSTTIFSRLNILAIMLSFWSVVFNVYLYIILKLWKQYKLSPANEYSRSRNPRIDIVHF